MEADTRPPRPEQGLTEAQWVEAVELHGRALCDTVKAAAEAGVPDALLLPALIAVFHEAGMIPDLDFMGLLQQLRG